MLDKNMDASVVITIKKDSKRLNEVLMSVFSQKTDFKYEVICIDATGKGINIDSSIQNSYKFLECDDNNQEDIYSFGMKNSSGEYVLFLSEVAIPDNDQWLDAFVSSMKNDGLIACAIGPRILDTSSNVIDRRNFEIELNTLGNKNKLYLLEDPERYGKDEKYRRELSWFYLDNTCINRKIYSQFSNERLDYADGEACVKSILENGFRKLYCYNSKVNYYIDESLDDFEHNFSKKYKSESEIFHSVNPATKNEAFKNMIYLDREDFSYLRQSKDIPNKFKWLKYAFQRNYLEYSAIKKIIELNQNYSIDNSNNEVENEIKAFSVENGKSVFSDYKCIVDRYNYSSEFKNKEYVSHKSDDKKILNWIIPAPGAGGGGTQTIMRFISKLENRDFHNKIYLMEPGPFGSDEHLKNHLLQFYHVDSDEFEAFVDIKDIGFGHANIATAWQTAYSVKRLNNCISKFYFVQDFEPMFYPVGSAYTFAKKTYSFGFRGITAGNWLKEKLHDEYGMKTDSFSFSFDKELYFPHQRKDTKKRVAFYARPNTARRSFEFGVIALSELKKKMPEVEIVMLGADLKEYNLDFDYINMGIVPVDKLSEIYSNSDLCLVLSDTNLSLLPLEVMASNSVSFCTKGKNSEWLVNQDNSILVDYDIDEVVDKMQYYLTNENLLEDKRKQGLLYAKKTSWDKEADKVNEFLLNGIEEDETLLEI